ncbi:unnamed protein product [Linum trigynum]|uniref:Uncharacterized protein n=1 Tax=Linum trigynum TaxID=586398 RepID=A0AAV2D2B7_9ROSI
MIYAASTLAASPMSTATDLGDEEVVDERDFHLRQPAQLPRRLQLSSRDPLLSSLSGLSSNRWQPKIA